MKARNIQTLSLERGGAEKRGWRGEGIVKWLSLPLRLISDVTFEIQLITEPERNLSSQRPRPKETVVTVDEDARKSNSPSDDREDSVDFREARSIDPSLLCHPFARNFLLFCISVDAFT